MQRVETSYTKEDFSRIGDHNEDVEYELGDQVIIDFQRAGQLGPGEVVQKLIWKEKGYDTFIGYVVRLEITDTEDMDFGFVGSNILLPAGNSNKRNWDTNLVG